MSVAEELIAFLAPLRLGLSSPGAAVTLLTELEILDGPTSLDALPGPLSTLFDAVDAALTTLDTLRGGSESAGVAAEQAILAARGLFDAVSVLAGMSEDDVTGLAAPFDDPELFTLLAERLPPHLLSTWLADEHPGASGTLELLGILTPDGTVDFAAAGGLVSDPAGHLGARVAADPAAFVVPLRRLGSALGGSRKERRVAFDELDEPYAVDEEPSGSGVRLAWAPPELGEGWAVDGTVVPVEAGLQFRLGATGAVAAEAVVSSTWTMVASLPVDAEAVVELTSTGPRVVASAVDDVSVELVGVPPEPWALVGASDGTRLELAGLRAELAATGLTGTPAVEAALVTDGLRLVVVGADGDSLLADLLGSSELAVDANLDATWSSTDGFRLKGTAGFEVTIPLGVAVGPVTFESLALGLHAAPEGASARITTAFGVTLGPFELQVYDLGLELVVSPADVAGAFGPVDGSLSYVPPSGLGLAIDAGVVRGGGVLDHDPDAGRYVGGAEIEIFGAGLSATGVVLTQLPDGSDGWSMFLSLGLSLPSIVIGPGFTLEGVGGLVGVHRGLDPDALGDAVRSGALDAILFPDDPVGDAALIFESIDQVFPPQRGQYVFGPVAKLGWGTPTLIELDVGVAIQLPDPVTVSVLGALSSVLPGEDLPLLKLAVAFAGTVDLTAGTLAIDASLAGSEVVGLRLTGDMAVRASFFDAPSFLVSFGGFHPDFAPPAAFPKLERLGVALESGDDLQVTLGGYFALTSNTVQFGAKAELFARAIGFTAEGGTSFDALITFSPFGFTIGLAVWLSISAGSVELLGVRLEGDFSGPNPFHVVGKATFKILGVKKSLAIDAVIGKPEGEPPPPSVEIQPLLTAELDRDDAWSVVSPEGGAGLVLAGSSDALAVHPAGRIRVAQRVVPLGRALDHYGNATVDGEDTYDVVADSWETEAVEEYFAGAQFFAMSEEEKLAAPSFVPMRAGLVIGASAALMPEPDAIEYEHEVGYRDPHGRGSEDPTEERPLLRGREAVAARALAGRRPTTAARRFSVGEPLYVVADAETGAASSLPADYYGARRRRDEGVLRPLHEIGEVP